MSLFPLLLVLAAAAAHAAWNIAAHGMSKAGPAFLFWGAVSSTLLWIGAVPFLGLGSDSIGAFFLGVGVSTVVHILYLLVLQRGYREGNLSTVYATARGTGPFISVVVAITLFGERVSVWALVGIAAIIIGIVALGLVDRGDGAKRRGIDPGILYGALTGVAIAGYTLWDAHAVREWSINPVAFMVGTTALQIPLYALMCWRRRRHETLAFGRQHWRRITLFGVLSPLSYILVLTAVTMAPVALVAPLREVSVVLVSLFGVFVLRESHPVRRVAAAAVVVAGIVLLAL